MSVRLEAIKSPTTDWLPEILSLLLHLSSDPANETRIESLDELERGSASPVLTWQEILQENPLDNTDGIWDIPKYGEASSDESEISTPRAFPPVLTQKPLSRQKGGKESDQAFVDAVLEYDGVKSSLLDDLVHVQFWRKLPESGQAIIVTEIQMTREVILMLLGLPTLVFQQNRMGSAEANSSYTLPNVSFEALTDMLSSFAQIGNQLSVIRKATKTQTPRSFVQSFQSSLHSHLKTVEKTLNEIEVSIISPTISESISLIQILERVQSATRPLLKASSIAALISSSDRRPFAVLEALYNLILHMQSVDDSESYYLAIALFIDCLTTYLKPISSWMESGSLGIDSDTFFITRVAEEVPPSQLWTDQYELVRHKDGTLRAPRFLHIAAQKIFNTGKSIAMLRQLGQNLEGSTKPSSLSLSGLLRSRLTAQPLCPFEEVFAAVLDTWIADHHHSYSSILYTALETSCGLWRSIDAIEHIYFDRNGHVASQIASSVFARIDARRGRVWHDRFILTDILRETYSPIASVESQRLAVAIVSPAGQSKSQGNRSVKDLAKMSVMYTLPWSVSNIIKPSSFAIFQSISTLLLQVSRSRYLLQQVYYGFSASKIRVSGERPMDMVSLSLHHRFLWFLDTVYDHLAGTVLLQASASMHQRMRAAKDVDQMIEVHESFVRHVGEECFVSVNRADVRKAIVSILDLVVLFEGIGTISMAAHKQPRPRRREVERPSESEDSDSGEDARVHTMPPRPDAAVDISRLSKISGTFDRLLQFIIANLARIQQEPVQDSHRSQALLDNLNFGARRA